MRDCVSLKAHLLPSSKRTSSGADQGIEPFLEVASLQKGGDAYWQGGLVYRYAPSRHPHTTTPVVLPHLHGAVSDAEPCTMPPSLSS